MPALVSSSSSQLDAKKLVNGKPDQPRKKRIVRRRGRGRVDDLSDEEVVREALSDSDFSSDSTASASESEDGEDGGDVRHGAKDHNSASSNSKPRYARSSAPSPPAVLPPVNGHAFIPPSSSWSEMVTAEQESNAGPSELPVIDFEDLATHAAVVTNGDLEIRPKSKKARARARNAKKSESKLYTNELDKDSAQPDAPAPRPVKPNPRQVYLDRLSSDPSYVPRVGAFWGHDERLMDKDLRSMSGWWRGRWQGQGRGRAMPRGNFGFRGRGRGRSFFRPEDAGRPRSDYSGDAEATVPDAPAPGDAIPDSTLPANRSWAHDGYEELRAEKTPPFQDRNGFRSDFRGAQRGFMRGRGPAQWSPAPSSRAMPSPTPSTPQKLKKPQKAGRQAKMERPWTKPLDTSLLSGPPPKPKATAKAPADIRVKLPGASESMIHVTHDGIELERVHTTHTNRSGPRSDAESDKAAVVNLPRLFKGKESRSAASKATTHLDLSTVESFSHQEEPRSALQGPKVKLPGLPSEDASPETAPLFSPPNRSESLPSPPQVDYATIRIGDSSSSNTLASNSPARRDSAIPETPRFSSLSDEKLPDGPEAPDKAYPSIQSTTLNYGAPEYQPYPTQLPPGVAVAENGAMYEVATGRQVVFTPAAPVFSPRPSHYIPSSPSYPIHHPQSMTPDFMSPPFVPPGLPRTPFYPGVGSPRYGSYPFSEQRDSAPIFVPARSWAALKIRAPGATSEPSSPVLTDETPKANGSTGSKIANTKSSLPRVDASEPSAAPATQKIASPLPTSPYTTQPDYTQAYSFYSPYEYGGFAPPGMLMEGQAYGYYPANTEAPYGAYAVPPPAEGVVDYSYSQYYGPPYAPQPDVRSPGVFY